MTDYLNSDYSKAIGRLFELQKFGMKFGLQSMNRILDRLDRPEKGLRLIHVAGTNGKGSTAAMLAEALNLSGYCTGLYTSPHLISFRERIQLGGRCIDQDDVVSLTEAVWPATDKDNPPTFFEFVTAMALLHYSRQKVDLAVIETGLGGRLDSTNVIGPILTGITNVSLEHTEHLGGTIEEIALEKAGIIKKNVPFVGGRICEPALSIIMKRTEELSVPSPVFLGRDYSAAVESTDDYGRPTIAYKGPAWELKNLKLALAGPYQADNAAMALAMAETLSGTMPLLSPKTAGGALLSVSWPGRAETFGPGAWPPGLTSSAPLILDGAHNPAGAKALAGLLKATKRKKLHLVVGVMHDKDIGGVLGPILPEADELYLTRPAYHRAASPELLLDRLTMALGAPRCPFALYPTIPEALTAAAKKAGPGDLVLVSGSLFTVGETRAYITGEPNVESN